jgi:DNA-directed RNA polymerase specialized sigma24 family protein
MVQVLEELAKQDKRWRAAAYNICGDKDLADDLVQDMYLKVYDYNYTKRKSALIYRIIKTTFFDHCKLKSKEIPFEILDYQICTNVNYGADDDEAKILESFSKLQWRQQELIEESYTKSLREIQKDFPMINYAYAYRQINEGMKSIFGEDFKKQYNNTRNKRK